MDENLGPEIITEVVETACEPEQTASQGIAVMGVGASAGGLDAFRLLLGALPVDTGLGIVLIQHLDPTHQSSLSEILGRITKMPVTEAGDGQEVEANHVYVIPPNTQLTIAKRVLKVSPRAKYQGLHLPIDQFLRALASDCGSKAIGVILSGAGSDGSLGLQAIKEAGGVTFAQEPATAEYASMPQMAEEASCIDFILPVAGIAAEVARIAKYPDFSDADSRERAGVPKAGTSALSEIFDVMHEKTGIDFSLYKENTVRRRIMRRVALRNIRSIEDYAKRLKDDAGECSMLKRDLLICVTSFFRDPKSFEALTKLVFPAIVQHRDAGKAIRIWVPGCATGEEAFSIGISLQEYLRGTGAVFPIQIFASDISESAIEKARSGRYLENIAVDVSPQLLDRYFTKAANGYQVGKALRALCVFSKHNLLQDPPFAGLDLISCRNVLIYLGAVQKNIITLFHYALGQNGFLMLGQSEAANHDDMFSLIDKDYKIYARRETVGKSLGCRALAGMVRREPHSGKMSTRVQPSDFRHLDLGKAVDHLLLSKFTATAVVVNDDLAVLELRGDSSPFFKLPSGKMNLYLLNLIPDTGLFLEIEKLVHEAKDSGETARRARVPYDSEGRVREVNIEITPLYSDGARALLVLLEPAPGSAEPVSRAAESANPRDEAMADRDAQIAMLRKEAAEARGRLLSIIEESQVSEEEGQSTAEEAQSANEELQSLNEELETAKEELQSTNEELTTLNQQLGSNNAELTLSRNFAMSIVECVRVPLVVLDQELVIRAVNASFSKTFKIAPNDAEGKHLYSLGAGAWDMAGLRDLLERVVQSGGTFEDFEVRREFPSIGTKDLIISGCRLDHLDQILVAIEDATAHKAVEKAHEVTKEALRQAEKMEAIGRLAGGIAHDFNNLLTIIVGYSRLAMERVSGDADTAEYLQEVAKAGQRAAVLTDQLLAFGRKKVLRPSIFDVNIVVADFMKMLCRIVGEHIQVVDRRATELWRVRADAGEIGRALMNLCLNARDSMPLGGTLTIYTRNVVLDKTEGVRRKLPTGQYIELEVRDSGTGMDVETQAHIFEAFYTTKKIGSGTGLGLPTVLGIIAQSGGAIWCQSDLGRGTSFKILLPASTAPLGQEESPTLGLAAGSTGSSEVVLLVEDEEMVRKLAKMILRARGYTILEARDGREGISVSDHHQGKIDLLLTDVVMPELGGRELAEHLLVQRPGLKVLYMSGHTEDVILKEGISAGAPFLQKPFTPAELARKVRDVLDSKSLSERSAEA